MDACCGIILPIWERWLSCIFRSLRLWIKDIYHPPQSKYLSCMYIGKGDVLLWQQQSIAKSSISSKILLYFCATRNSNIFSHQWYCYYYCCLPSHACESSVTSQIELEMENKKTPELCDLWLRHYVSLCLTNIAIYLIENHYKDKNFTKKMGHLFIIITLSS